MIIGIPKEIKNAENRVAIVPGGSETLIAHGHKVLMETGAGLGSGFGDEDYARTGVEIVTDPKSVYDWSDLVLKVKEPLPSEYDFLKEGQVLFTYLHLAAAEDLTQNLLRRKVVAIAYEAVELDDGLLPLLSPMSEIAGRMAPQEGAKYLEETSGGRGVLLSGVPGVPSAQVVILGGGHVGFNAARIATGMGATVTVLDVNPRKLQAIDDYFRGKITTVIADTYNVRTSVRYADLVIGAVLVPGARAPRLISRDTLKTMKKGAVIVDVAIDQGGCAETSRPTTHDDPIYTEEGVVHYAVANMPGAVPRTATRALTLNTLPYVLKIAEEGWRSAILQDKALCRGVSTVNGSMTHKTVSEVFGLPYTPITHFLEQE
jgi:alanine dehydrogenase